MHTETSSYLASCRQLVVQGIQDLVPQDTPYGPALYDLVLDYPLRQAKALRPALAIATCRAHGGRLAEVAPTATVLELYHSAFLVHDDIEDDSEQRRGQPTLHREHGVPIAINVGDAMLAMALDPLLDNVRVVGLARALRILREVSSMARLSAEGQAVELDWIRHGRWALEDADYVEMVVRKTAWYTFITPITVGALVAGVDGGRLATLRTFGEHLGIAFQVQDDVLNLTASSGYGKERSGDLWEGKRTLILLHALRSASPTERTEALRILGLARPGSVGQGPGKTGEEVDWLRSLIDQTDSLVHARRIALDHAHIAQRILEGLLDGLPPSAHGRFLASIVSFVVDRDW